MRNEYFSIEELEKLKYIINFNDSIYSVIRDITRTNDLKLLNQYIDTMVILMNHIPSERHEFSVYKKQELKVMIVEYLDLNGDIKSDFSCFGGAYQLVMNAHRCVKDSYKKLIELKEKLKQEQVTDSEFQVGFPPIMYKFINEYFLIDVKEDEFTNINSLVDIKIRQKDNRLTKKNITKPMIGFLFNFIIKDQPYLKNRLTFDHYRKKSYSEVDTLEASRELRKQESRKTLSLKKFEDNLHHHYNAFIDNAMRPNN